MDDRRPGLLWLALAAGALGAAALAGGRSPHVGAQGDVRVFLPMAVHAVAMEALPTARVIELTPTDPATPTPTETLRPPPPTFTPLPTWTPEPTEPPVPSRIHGHLVFEGDPMDPGFGTVGGPQIELRTCRPEGGAPCRHPDWTVVANTVTEDGGAFEFRSPPPLAEGGLYQVWWTNEDSETSQGDSRFVGRWWSRELDAFGPGDEVDVGTFELGDVKYTAPFHDTTFFGLPIPYKWKRRANRAETYRWSLFKGCGDAANRENAYRTEPLGYVDGYTMEAIPPGYRIGEKYCWYVFVEDGDNGTGWPFFDWRITFGPQPGADSISRPGG
jgi:hypothetical protein